MSAIAVEQRQYKTYILTTQDENSDSENSDALLEILPERGGIVTRWQVQGQEIFYLDKERLVNPDLSIRGGNPILFPICGNLPNNTYTHNGKSYQLKQHGFARELPWTVIEQTTQEGASLVLSLESNDETRAVYPFDFQLKFGYTLYGDRLETRQEVINHSDEPMPFSLGFHPYFSVSDKSQLEFEIPGTEYQNHKTASLDPFNGSFDFEQDEIDVIFRGITKQTASVCDRNRGMRLKLEFSNTFSELVFWTVKGKDFYCLEPWTAARNALNTGDRLLYLDPSASLVTEMNLSVEFLKP